MPLGHENTTFYPVAIEAQSLRPGAVFVDPHSHLMVVTAVGETGYDDEKLLLAVDGQPDGTIAIKRYWRGTFVFGSRKASVGAGFMRYRPIVKSKLGYRLLQNAELEKLSESAFSMQQKHMTAQQFYDATDDLFREGPIDAIAKYKQLHADVLQLLNYRVTSVQRAENFLKKNPKQVIAVPKSGAIFRNMGDWEIYSTPFRDLRLLLSLDMLKGFPKSVMDNPKRYGYSTTPIELHHEMATLHAKWSLEMTFEYTRSNGEPFELSIQDILGRMVRFEAAYDPNMCPEMRWGAEPGTAEAETCKRNAPKAHRAIYKKHRHWFVDRYACGNQK